MKMKQSPVTRQAAVAGGAPASSLAVLVAAAFLIVAPLSLATELESAPHLKLARIGLCGVGVVLAAASGALAHTGGATHALFVFSAFYVAAAAWSAFPLAGVLYKGIYFSAILFGLALGATVRHYAAFRSMIRVLGMVAAGASAIVLYQYLTKPLESTHSGRLAVYGMNANAVGMTAAGYLFLTVFLALTEHRLWRVVASIASGLLLVIILATGSRAAMAMAMLGGTIQLMPWLPYPRRALLPIATIAILVTILSGSVEVQAVERFTDFQRNTREGMWKAGVRLFLQAPAIGHGWLSSGRSTSNLQNVYLQVLAETGVAGGILLLIAAFHITNLLVHGPPRGGPMARAPFYLSASIVVGLAVHGIAESSLLHGTTLNTFLFGLALGLLEQLRHLLPALESPPERLRVLRSLNGRSPTPVGSPAEAQACRRLT